MGCKGGMVLETMNPEFGPVTPSLLLHLNLERQT